MGTMNNAAATMTAFFDSIDNTIAAAQADADQWHAKADAADADAAQARSELATATADRDDARNTAEAFALQVQTLTADLADRDAQIAALKAQIDSQPVPTPDPATRYGACPAAGGSGLAAAQAVIDKWGPGAAIRQFFPGGFTANPNHPDGASLVHTSYKPDLAAVNAGTLDAAITALAKATPAGDILEIWHEADLKVRKGTLDKTAVVAAKNRFYDLVKAANPHVLVATTYTGWLFEPKSGLDPQDWSGVRADLLGVDLDGISVTAPPYPDWSDEIPAVKTCADQWGYAGWCVPELGAPRAGTGDTDGAIRAAWATACAKACDGALYVAWFEYPTSPNYELTTTAEIAAWKTLIG